VFGRGLEELLGTKLSKIILSFLKYNKKLFKIKKEET
jgi:hypothetical protein